MKRRQTLAAVVSLTLMLASPVFAAGDEPLIVAVKSRDVAAVRTLLASRADVNATEGDGATALHWAAYHDDAALVETLVKAGARVDVANDLGVTPLFASAENGNAAIARRLLAAGANANATLVGGESLLMTASRSGATDVVQALLEHGANPNVTERSHGQTALMWAVAQRHPEVVRQLLARGADTRARTTSYPQVVKTVLQATNPAAIVEIQQGGYTPLLFAARVGDRESAALLLAAGADVNDVAPLGTSALTVAVHSGNAPVASLLLEKGAEPNHAAAGYTALHAALLHRDASLVKQLLEHGADPNAPVTMATPTRRDSVDFYIDSSYVGATPAWLAARFNEPEILRLLLDHGADGHAVFSPTYYVGDGPARPKDAPPADGPDRKLVKEGTVTLVMAAIGLGGRQPLFGDTLLGRLAESARGDAKQSTLSESTVLETVRIGAAAGGDLRVANADGDTALHAAATRSYAAIVTWLVEHGADVNAVNAKNQTPLDLANGALATEVSEYLQAHDAVTKTPVERQEPRRR